MRTSLLAVFLCAFPVMADESAARNAIEKLGGKSEIDTKLATEARVSAKFDSVTDAMLFGLKKHPEIGSIEAFDATRCTDKGLAALKELPHLRKLAFGKAAIGPAAATSIGQLKELRHLSLPSSGITDTELARMKELVLLEYLALSDNPQITDKGMATVKGFDRLRALHLNKTAIGDKGLAELKPLDGLRTLSLRVTRVTGDAADKFTEGMPNLRKVAW